MTSWWPHTQSMKSNIYFCILDFSIVLFILDRIYHFTAIWKERSSIRCCVVCLASISKVHFYVSIWSGKFAKLTKAKNKTTCNLDGVKKLKNGLKNHNKKAENDQHWWSSHDFSTLSLCPIISVSWSYFMYVCVCIAIPN